MLEPFYHDHIGRKMLEQIAGRAVGDPPDLAAAEDHRLALAREHHRARPGGEELRRIAAVLLVQRMMGVLDGADGAARRDLLPDELDQPRSFTAS